MKKIFTVFTLTALLSTLSQAAIIMTFDTRDDSGTTTTTIGQTALIAGESPNSGVLDTNLEASSLTFGAGTSGSNASAQRFAYTGIDNPTIAGALAADEYLTFTVDAKAGYKVSVDTMRIGFRFPGGGTSWGWGLYSSLDNFSAPLAGEMGASFPQDYLVTTANLGITGQTGPIEFRIVIAAANPFETTGVQDQGTPENWPDYGQAIQVNGLVEVDSGYVPHIPATPSTLAASVISPIAIDLSWNDTSDNETGFYIERGLNSSSFSTIATLDENTTSFSDSGLSSNTEYFYRVSAFNAIGSSTNNPVSSATTPLVSTAPEAPTNLVATAMSSNSVDLVWSDNSLLETGFVIERKSGGAFAQIATVAADSVSFSDTGLAAGTQYTYQVKAVNSIGDSSYTDEASATTFSANSGIIMTFDTRDEPNTNAISTTVGQTALFAGESPTSGILDAGLEASSLTFGAGTSGSNLTAKQYVIKGINNSTIAGALAADEYLSFTVDAKAGYQVSMESIRLQLRFNGNGGILYNWGLYSSADNFAAPLGSETGISIVNPEDQFQERTVNVSSIGDQTGPIEFRLVIGAPSEWDTAGVADNGDDTTVWPDYGQAIQVNGYVQADNDGSPYSIWGALYGLTEGPDGDDDDDNMSNFYEYALNGNPTNPADIGILEYGSDGNGFFTYVYGKRTDDTSLVYTLVDTPDLVIPTASTNAWDSSTSGPSGAANFDSVTNKYDMTGEPQQFIKLIIE